MKCKLIKLSFSALVAGGVVSLANISALAADVSRGQEASTPAEDANELAKELANPVANLWSLQFQFNNFELTNDR